MKSDEVLEKLTKWIEKRKIWDERRR